MKIAICEDNLEEQEFLQKQLIKTNLINEKASFSFFEDGSDIALQYMRGNRYDIVFLDVDMPKVNGIKTGKYIRNIKKKAIIIFVTSYPQYALDAFDCNAFHYLIKTTEYEKFYNVILKAINHFKGIHHEHLIKLKGGEVINLNIDDIYYIESCRKHVIYHLKDSQYETKDTLTSVFEKIAKYGFYQVHQGYIVNFDKVSKFQRDYFVMKNGEKVMVSIRKRTEAIVAYANYMERYL